MANRYAVPTQGTFVSPGWEEMPRPRTIDAAVRLMWIQAGLILFAIPASMLMHDEMRGLFEEQAQRSGRAVNTASLDSVLIYIDVLVAMGALLIAVTWLWMATANGRGRPYGRVVATVLFLVMALGFAGNLVDDVRPQWAATADIVYFAICTVIIVLLWVPSSSRYYREASRFRRLR
ncbi:hypothetical protein JQN72_02685 [Phycicoccus sp. CSK15P-2]|uniref:hypothetical protein n=1 Tax=Phycicoccus sp. CSK15P-2 TaxID=2807627 RepID=UPI001950DB8B|nr:hypothetical protein [Phycicoccus sp. CSK15P-2]MBM6403154.1 hypothetical protein [Phycicoccus sp. CSK15P-2]